MSARTNRLIAYFLPPIVTDAIRRLKRRGRATPPSARPEWEAVPNVDRIWNASAGWLHDSIVAEQRRKWSTITAAMARPLPLGRSHEARLGVPASIAEHNLAMTFGYALGRAAEVGNGLSILDWGGGIGHYHVLARELRPDLRLDYTVKDLPGLCAAGRELNSTCRYVDGDEAALSRRYDLVFASSSIHYTRDVHGLLRKLCAAADRWLMITRQPMIDRHDDFVVLQRAYAYGYDTEYPGWFLNRGRLLETVTSQGFELEREFLLDHQPAVHNAPEQCYFAGFLFRRRSQPPR